MPVGTEQILAVFYDDKPAIANKSTPGIDHLAIRGRFYRLILVSTYVDTAFSGA